MALNASNLPRLVSGKRSGLFCRKYDACEFTDRFWDFFWFFLFFAVCNGSYGAGTYGMAGRAFDPRFMFTWPQSQVSVMGAEQAAGVLTDIKLRQLARNGQRLSEQELAAIREPILDDYREQSSAYYATSEIWDDGILDPVDTRNALGIALSASLNARIELPHYGVFRM